MSALPETMQAVYYPEPRKFSAKSVPLPSIGSTELLVKVELCGVCGTDQHVHEGEFISQFPLIPGHEGCGKVVAMGSEVQGFAIGDMVVADPTAVCGYCHFCRRGQPLFCENIGLSGISTDGAFAEYLKFPFAKCYKVRNLTKEEAILIEPAACAVHGMDKLQMPFGAKVLLIGAGPTGLILAQLMKLGGASHVTIASNEGIKMDTAKRLNCADAYIPLNRKDAKAQWEKIKTDNPYGFDVVAECTGVESIVNDAINYVCRGGTLLVYGVYANAARVSWSPTRIFVDEIRIIGSFAQTLCFPRAVALLDSKKVRVDGMVTDVFPLDNYQGTLDKLAERSAFKVAMRP